jgi:hypothetical protein
MINLLLVLIFIIVVALLHNFHSNHKIGGGGSSKNKKTVNNILVVDGANMYSQWYIKKFRQRMDFKITNQKNFIKYHILMMDEHYNNFVARGNDNSIVHYVLKNPMIREKLNDKMYGILGAWLISHPQARISIALDYSWWKGEITHTHKGRDDFLCFYLAQRYKKFGHKVAIMSEDKYRDYECFNIIPDFTHVYLQVNKKHKMKLLSPSSHKLGKFENYKIERINLKFTFRNLISK